MGGVWKSFDQLSHQMAIMVVVLLIVLLQNTSFCWSLNSEGLTLLGFKERIVTDPFGALTSWNNNGESSNPCSWFGVECCDGNVVVLNLRDLGLGGTLAPELGKLLHIKSIVLRNNSFFGNIPKEIGELKELEVLDLGYNNISGPFPSEFSNNQSLTTLLLDNNYFLDNIPPELNELKTLSEFQVDEDQLLDFASRESLKREVITQDTAELEVLYRRLLQVTDAPNPSTVTGVRRNEGNSLSPSPSPSPSSYSSTPVNLPSSPSSLPVLPSDSPFSSLPSSDSPSPSPIESSISSPSASPSNIFLAPSPSPLLEPIPESPPVNPPVVTPFPPKSLQDVSPSPTSTPTQVVKNNSKKKHLLVPMLAGFLGGASFLLISAFGIVCFRGNKVVTVKPWSTGLSGQLQKAFVTGVPKLKRSELLEACEDFSNIIGTFSDGIVYKGTLSSGVEIAVTSTAVTSRKYWSKTLEERFRKKIETLSRVNHKNFVNLIGFCEEEEPFTRMLVFEYAPNGTLYEHLHIKEAEHLDWGMRLRIAMGMAYCLEHNHQLTPPIAHKDLQSSSIYLTEDYAAKISDFRFWNEVNSRKMGSSAKEKEHFETPSADPERNVYSFGVILFEMLTGRIPYYVENCSLMDWASHYLKIDKPFREIVDPTLKFYQEEELQKLFEVIQYCVNPDPKQRPTMTEIASRLKEITAMGPDGATPKSSPLWWAELEIMSSSEGS